jgi:hypothetical protein
MINKKGRIFSGKIIKLLLMVLVVLTLMLAIFGAGVWEKIKDITIGGRIDVSDDVKQAQITVQDTDKIIGPAQNNYPTFYLIYFLGQDDRFWIRWNSNLNKPQIVADINFRWPGEGQSDEWLIDPGLDKDFRKSKMREKEKADIEFVMNSENYVKWLENLLKLGNEYTLQISKKVGSDILKSKFGFPVAASNAEELNALLREKQPEYFFSFDTAKSNIAGIQIKNVEEKLNSYEEGKGLRIEILNLEGWYFVNFPKEKICFCPVEACDSEYAVCEEPKYFLPENYFLDDEEFVLRIGEKNE